MIAFINLDRCRRSKRLLNKQRKKRPKKPRFERLSQSDSQTVAIQLNPFSERHRQKSTLRNDSYYIRVITMGPAATVPKSLWGRIDNQLIENCTFNGRALISD
ncbi:hypothetical protein CEXT_187491 [Caerostris extrusa]|uniref:Uncharacterized protein n=1 Tax=Caerostris extrusa TaxID=172846 RepID=A0AAV4WYZ0_CAEEX|nr:hypothetical protein CEXT_187491 [Caerostris extrusa]